MFTYVNVILTSTKRQCRRPTEGKKMAKIKYFAVDANGVEHTRSSARTYTHMVVVRVNLAVKRAGAKSKAEIDYHTKNYDYYCTQAAGKGRYPSSEKEMVLNKEIAAMTCEQYVQSEIEKRIAKINKDGLGEYSDNWFSAGWCGRLDLAQKLAREFGCYGITAILEAQTK
jgi:hypothetical protein